MQSKPQVVRWLFTCKGLTPIKSTDNKNTGVRAMPWEKVMELPPDRQKEYSPATDKQTLTILSEQAPILARLLELKDIENLCKAFLKEPQIDDETGEVTRENGLHYWLSPVDNRLHPFYSLTETGRHQWFRIRWSCIRQGAANWQHLPVLACMRITFRPA